MPTLVADCPRCGVKKHTFDIGGVNYTLSDDTLGLVAEAFSTCRACSKGTIFVVNDKGPNHFVENQQVGSMQGNINDACLIQSYINIIDFHTIDPPKYLPADVQKAFSEGATAYAVNCWNASACMFRASIDIASRNLLPGDDVDGLDDNIRRSLARRLKWLFKSNRLPGDLESLASCVKEDSNEAIHSTTLVKEDAIDLMEFTVALLERIYTEPEKIKMAEKRRRERREKARQNAT